MRERILYIDCGAGVSGDMLLGALVDLGVSLPRIKQELSKLGVDGFRLTRSRGTRGGVAGTSIRVVTPGDRGHRHWSDFQKILVRSSLSPESKDRSLALVRRLYEAEAHVHGASPETIHLHELGSLDTLVDVVGAVVGIALLEVVEVSSSPVNVGGGFVDTEHGRMSVPAPATAVLLEGAPVFSDGSDFERTTPTGALLATGLASRFGAFPAMNLRRVGYGLGTKDPREGRPNALRLVLGDRSGGGDSERPPSELALVLEATLDDITPQEMGYLSECLLAAGVLDVFVTPVQMKKNRPGVNVTVLVHPGDRERVSDILFSEGVTLGLRWHEVRREVLERRFATVKTRFGEVKVKEGLHSGRIVRRAPEYEDCRRLAAASGVPFSEVHRAALRTETHGTARSNVASAGIEKIKKRKRNARK
jgi:pyridinium-3,5-bisthiocarboxylic acid mononucleotide nickel chelatase